MEHRRTDNPNAPDETSVVDVPRLLLLILRRLDALETRMSTSQVDTSGFRPIAPIAPGIRLVKETELPQYVPWSLSKIRRAVRDGKLRGYPDPLNPRKIICNLDEILSLVRTGKQSDAQPRYVPPDIKITL